MTPAFFFLLAATILMLVNSLIVSNIKKLYYKDLLKGLFEEAHKTNKTLTEDQYNKAIERLETVDSMKVIWDINKIYGNNTKQT